MSLPSNISLLTLTAWKLWNGKRQWAKESAAYLDHYLEKVRLHHDDSLSEGIFHKLKDYPFEALFAAELIADLANYTMNASERKLISLTGALLALGDVYCDDTKVPFGKVQLMLEEPHQAPANDSLDHLFLAIYKEVLIELDDVQQVHFHRALIQGFEAEKESRMLQNGRLPKEEVMRIIKNKGGSSLLIYRSLMHFPITDEEQKALFEAGAFTQLVDDLFDLPWDSRKNAQSSATEVATFDDISEGIRQQFENLSLALKQTNFHPRRQKNFLFVFHIFMLGTGAFIRQIQEHGGKDISPQQLVSFNKSQLRFHHFGLRNVMHVLPGALGFRS